MVTCVFSCAKQNKMYISCFVFTVFTVFWGISASPLGKITYSLILHLQTAFVPTLECNAPNGEQHLWIWAWTQSKREMKDERLRKGNILRCSRHFLWSYYVVFKFSSENLLPSGWVVIRIPAVTRRTILSLRSAVYRAGNQKWHFLRVTVCIMYLGCVFVDMIWKI